MNSFGPIREILVEFYFPKQNPFFAFLWSTQVDGVHQMAPEVRLEVVSPSESSSPRNFVRSCVSLTSLGGQLTLANEMCARYARQRHAARNLRSARCYLVCTIPYYHKYDSPHQNRLSQIEKIRFVLREQNHQTSDDCCRIRRKFDSPMQFHDMIPVNNDILFSIMVDNRNHFENDLDEDMMLASAAGDVFVSLPRTIRKRYRRKTSTSC